MWTLLTRMLRALRDLLIDRAAHDKLDEILRQLERINERETLMSADLTALEAAVQANTDAEQSAIALINGIAAELAAAKTDPAKVQSLADKLTASAAALSAAVLANTPAAPPAALAAPADPSAPTA